MIWYLQGIAHTFHTCSCFCEVGGKVALFGMEVG